MFLDLPSITKQFDSMTNYSLQITMTVNKHQFNQNLT